ncbi:MAG: peptidoglycan DD-metalloendopeptidase family protein [Jiangellaceae bacterium]
MTSVTSVSIRGRMLSLALAAGLVVAALSPAWASDPEDRRRVVQQRLEQAQAELNQSTEALDTATQSFRDAQSQLPAAEQALAAAEQALAVAQERLAQAQGELAAAKVQDALAADRLAAAEQRVLEQVAKIADITQRIDGKRADMSRVAVQAYQGGSMGQLLNLATVFEAENLQDFTTRVSYAKSVLNAEDTVLTGLEGDRAELANERVKLEKLREEAQRLREEAARHLERTKQLEAEAATAKADAEVMEEQARAAKADVDTLVAQRSNAVTSAEQARADDASQYAALERERRAIDAEIAEIARRAREQREREERERQARARSSGGSGSASSGSSSGGSSGSNSSTGLRYPVSNPYITSSYGMRVHPITGVYKLHDGTDFRAYCGTPIRAAASGRVVWARYRGGYGNQVAIDHGVIGGNALMSSYSHLSRFTASSGERVSRGEIIGYSGSTGYSTACHLHFMVYDDGVRTNPMRFL